MREIKFRFWDPYKKQMNPDHRDGSIWNGLLVCEGDTIPLQFTGLKDKNGREVYEGDIYRNGDNGLIGKLTFTYPGERLLYGTEYKDGRIYNNQPFHLYDTTNFEVIGNIYENRELLEQAA